MAMVMTIILYHLLGIEKGTIKIDLEVGKMRFFSP